MLVLRLPDERPGGPLSVLCFSWSLAQNATCFQRPFDQSVWGRDPSPIRCPRSHRVTNKRLINKSGFSQVQTVWRECETFSASLHQSCSSGRRLEQTFSSHGWGSESKGHTVGSRGVLFPGFAGALSSQVPLGALSSRVPLGALFPGFAGVPSRVPLGALSGSSRGALLGFL